jgi:dTDP-4-dehydrorhamnose reductase
MSNKNKLKVLVLGSFGLMGYTLFNQIFRDGRYIPLGTIRREEDKRYFPKEARNNLFVVEDLLDCKLLSEVYSYYNPDIVINCISLNRAQWHNHTLMRSIFVLLPKKIQALSLKFNCRFIQISSDGIYSGNLGNYTEVDIPDAQDNYGKLKYEGEINEPNCLIIRTSMIGHEIIRKNNFLDWFLSQDKECLGHVNEFFSALTTLELANIFLNILIPDKSLIGIYNVSSAPISKYHLLCKIAETYKKNINIVPKYEPVSNRSLDSTKFYTKTRYFCPSWDELLNNIFVDRDYYSYSLRGANV